MRRASDRGATEKLQVFCVAVDLFIDAVDCDPHAIDRRRSQASNVVERAVWQVSESKPFDITGFIIFRWFDQHDFQIH